MILPPEVVYIRFADLSTHCFRGESDPTSDWGGGNYAPDRPRGRSRRLAEYSEDCDGWLRTSDGSRCCVIGIHRYIAEVPHLDDDQLAERLGRFVVSARKDLERHIATLAGLEFS
jgi:hypothetical protein